LKDILVNVTADDFWMFSGTQLKDVPVSRTADDLWKFGETQLMIVFTRWTDDL
jgi:uncharacterized protein YneR